MTLSEEGQQRFQAIRQFFLNTLPERRDNIRIYWNNWVINPEETGKLKELFTIVHQLAGTGAAFGFPHLSESADSIEKQLKNIVEGKQTLEEVPVQDLTEQINNLLQLLDELIAAG